MKLCLVPLALIVAAFGAPPTAAEPPSVAPTPSVEMIQPLPRDSALGTMKPGPRDGEGVAAIRAALLGRETSDAARAEAFHQLTERGAAAAPVLLELRPLLARDPRWELVYVDAIAAVPDRRLIPEAIRLAKAGATPEVREIAIDALATDLATRAARIHVVHEPDGSLSYKTDAMFTVGGRVESHGLPLKPGGEKPIFAAYDELKTRPELAASDAMEQLKARIAGYKADDARWLATKREMEHPTHEGRMAEARRLADGIAVGTTRAEVEKVFKEENGGIQPVNTTSYYLGQEVTVEVPYDEAGGRWKPTNHVTGPLRVYRSWEIID
jgi:hypothetical protein